MNCPHSEPEIGMDDAQDEMFEVTPSFLAFSRKVYKIWQSGDTDPEKAEQIRVLTLSALAARSDDEGDDTSIHSDEPAEPHTQGVEDSRLESEEDREIESAVNARVAKGLMSHHSNF